MQQGLATSCKVATLRSRGFGQAKSKRSDNGPQKGSKQQSGTQRTIVY